MGNLLVTRSLSLRVCAMLSLRRLISAAMLLAISGQQVVVVDNVAEKSQGFLRGFLAKRDDNQAAGAEEPGSSPSRPACGSLQAAERLIAPWCATSHLAYSGGEGAEESTDEQGKEGSAPEGDADTDVWGEV